MVGNPNPGLSQYYFSIWKVIASLARYQNEYLKKLRWYETLPLDIPVREAGEPYPGLSYNFTGLGESWE